MKREKGKRRKEKKTKKIRGVSLNPPKIKNLNLKIIERITAGF